ncbi:VCBS domain-containing protein [Kordiimonas sp.]|uniref:VCBS domain-containing protein n=1 Tax=Kordiimonas sp. TaxID=1970157 RepID=UPI003A9320DA
MKFDSNFNNQDMQRQEVEPKATHATSAPSHDVVVVDTTVDGYETLLAGVSPGTEVILIGAEGLSELASALEGRSDIDSLQILSHGDVGSLRLGNDEINASTVADHADALARIGAALSEDGDILLYGCRVAEGGAGFEFIQMLADVTGADVAASDDLTGASSLGGDWDLEVNVGNIAETTAFSEESMGGFDALLAAPSVGTEDFGTSFTFSLDTTSVANVAGSGFDANASGSSEIDITTSQRSDMGTVNIQSTSLIGEDVIWSGKSVVFGDLEINHNSQTVNYISLSTNDDSSFQLNGFDFWYKASGTRTFTITGHDASGTQISGATFSLTSLTEGTDDGGRQFGYATISADNLGSSFDNIVEFRITPSDTSMMLMGIDDVVVATAVSNAAPELGGSPADTSATEDVATAIDLSNYTISDDGVGDITLTLAVDRGTISSADGNGAFGGVTIATSGTTSMTLAGSVADLNTYLNDTSHILFTTDQNDTTTATLTVTPNDGTIDGTADTISITITPANDAPVLDNSGAPTLTAINEDAGDDDGSGADGDDDATNNANNTGTSIADMVTDGSITDVDGSAVEAIAVTNVDNTNGVWQYSTNNGSSWTNFSGVTGNSVDIESASVLLDGTLTGASTNLIRFVPDADYNGTATITYRAWDKSSGSVGSTADTSTNGGTTAFSSATEDATLTINSVNDEPTLTATGEDPDFTEGGSAVDLFSSVALSTVDGNGVASYTITVTNVTDGANEIINAGGKAFALTNDTTDTINGGLITVHVAITDTTATLTFTDSSGSPAASENILEGMSYENTSENPTEGDRVVTITSLSDNGGTANGGDDTATLSLSSTVTVIAVNDAPTSADAPTDVTVLEDTESSVDLSDITFDDPDSDIITVTLTASAGTFSSPADGEGVGSGVTETLLNSTTISLVGTAADITSYLDDTDAIQFTGAENVNGEDAATITITANDDDGSGDVTLDTINLDITAVNDTPVFAGLDGTPAFTEEGAAVTLDSNVTVADVELDALNGGNGYYSGATLTIARNGGANANDSFSFDTSGNTFVTSGSASAGALNTFVDDDTFASYTVSGGTLTITFTSAATAATTSLVNDVLQHIRYENTSDDPGDSVQLDWTFSDGNSGNAQGSGDNPGTDTGSTTVSITEVNDAPTLDATGSNPTFTEGGAASDVFNTVTASTIETGQTISGLILTVTNVSDTENEILNIGNTAITLDNGEGGTTATNSLTYSVSVSDGTATVTLSGGTMSAAATQTLVDGISYENTSDNPTTGANRVVTITGITDSGGTADGGSNASAPNLVSTVSLTGVNDPPVVTGVDGDSSDVIVGSGSQVVSLFSDADVTNVDSPDFNGGFLTITQNTGTTNGDWAVDGTTVASGGDGTVSAGETIEVSGVSIGTVDATDDGQGGTDFTINFNSNATPERVETLLQNLYYGAPSGIDARTFTLTLNDADGTANSGDQDTTADFTINVTPNPPVLGNLDGDSFTFTEGDDATNLDVDGDVTLTDGDSTDFNGGNITIDFQSGQTTDDRLVLDTGTVTLSAGQTAGSTVTVGGVVIGTIEAGSTGGESEDLVITFNSNATPALVQTLIGAIQYDNASDDAPTDGNRVIRVTVTDSDTNPASDSADITVNVDPVNDTATFDGDLTGTMNEDTDTLSGDLDVTDPDTDEAHVGDDPINGMSVVGTYGNLDIDESGAWTYDLDEDNAAVQALADGDTLGDTLTINSVDGTEQDIVITITGVNDAATFGGDLTGALNEDVDTTITGTATVDDVDTGEDVFTAGTINGAYGDLTIAANGDWSYDLNETLAGVQGLGDGDTLGDTLTVTSDDGTEQDIIITINGVNDVATFDGNLTGTLNEDVDTTITGTATVDDIDTGEDVFTAGTVNGTYGDLTIAANGDWSYDLNETLAGVQGLGNGDTLGDTLTVTSGDGTEQNITITITGVNDVATIGGALSVSVDEDATYSIGDTATVTDVDTGEDVFDAEVINGTYGNLTIAANGEWSYDLNENDATVQGLGAGDTLGDTLTVSSADGTTEDIVITINGANDAPTAASNSVAVDEDTTHALTVDNFGFDDADSGDSLTSVRIDSLTLASGDTLKLSGTDVSVNDVISVSDITAGNLVYTPAADAFGTARSSFTFSVHDGTTYAVSASTLTFNVADIADAAPPTSPTLSNRSVKENVAGAVVGTISSTDPNGDNITFSVNDSRFEVAGTTLKLKAGISLDFETEPTVDLSLRATDSTGLSIIRVVRLSVVDTDEPTSKKGGETADTLSGTNSGDTLDGANGDDTLDGGEGNDTLLGGNGNDTLFGGDDDDSLRGDAGDDTLDGGTGNDTLRGGDGNDTLEGNDGDDHLWGGKAEVANDSLAGGGGNDRMGGGRGNDIIEGGDGDDTLYGYIGDDTLLGGDGSDLIFNGLGDDSVDGGSGSDILWASAGDDILTGGDGGDTFVFGALAGNDTITDFSTEEDTLDLSLSGAGFTSAGDVTDASIETIVGGEAGVLIDLGGGESVFLMGLSLDDLSGAQILI